MVITERDSRGRIVKKHLSSEEARRIASIVPRNRKKKRKLKRGIKNE